MATTEQTYQELWAENPLQAFEIPTADIIVVPELAGRGDVEYKRDPKKVKELAASIQATGQIQAAVCGINTNADYGTLGAPILYVGFGRYEACVLAELPLVCMYSPISTDEALARGMHENTKREDLSPVQIAMNIQRLNEKGMKDADIARGMGWTPGNVVLHKRFTKAGEDGKPLYSKFALNAIHTKKITARDAYEMKDLDNSEAIDNAIKAALDAGETSGGGKSVVTSVVRKATRKNAKKKGKKAKGRTLKEVTEFLVSYDVAGVPASVRKTVHQILDFVRGAKDEEDVEKVLMKIAA